ncbi:DUF2442 domain-containing protein [Muriicola sp.]|uniref:DUF2442 domain-containing protein n=1 Tax=Muriicola sp. TaxID=2020856 RepID=UPI003C78EE3E
MSTSNKIINKPATDPLDRLIFEEGLRIKTLWFDQDLDLIIVLLNNKKIIQRPISDFARLKNASIEQLANYESDGIGIHWPDMDEDLSLRGFLKYELAHFAEKAA